MILLHPHSYVPPSVSYDREETLQKNLFQQIQLLDLTHPLPPFPDKSIVLLGFSCDEGVKRNLGRFGAADGPRHLRNTLKKFPLSFKTTIPLWDAGTICCCDDNLEQAQKLLGETVGALRAHGAFVIVLGGGHELSWGHFQGLIKTYPKPIPISLSQSQERPSMDIINFDAHFDLRPLFPNNKGSSGSSFRQIHDYCQENNIGSRYACLGVQPFSNTSDLFEYAESIKAYHILAEEMLHQPHRVHESLGLWLASAKKIYLTLCLDVFAAAFAPGVSAPQALGLSPHTLLPFFRQVLESGKVIGFDVAELNPIYDQDSHTAKLAASFVLEVLSHFATGKVIN
ncbi:MAG: formimidoylglutamase [Chthoniobacterales bacterium]